MTDELAALTSPENSNNPIALAQATREALAEGLDETAKRSISKSLGQNIEAGRIDCVLAILDSGAEPDWFDEHGATPIMVACNCGNAEAASILLARGASHSADPQTLGMPNAYPPIIQAGACAIPGAAECIHALAQSGASIDERDCEGTTALMAACERGLWANAKLLLNLGADPLLTDASGRTARERAQGLAPADYDELDHAISIAYRKRAPGTETSVPEEPSNNNTMVSNLGYNTALNSKTTRSMNSFERIRHLAEQTILSGIAKLLVGAYPHWTTGTPLAPGKTRIFFANHSSNLDTVALLAALPFELRKTTRPVAAKDYWIKTWATRHAALVALNAVLIDRKREEPGDPLAPAMAALEEGSSLIIFPEGQRNIGELPGPFKSGIYHLSKKYPEVDFVPVYLENIVRSMPKGNTLPLPLICRARFGEPIRAGVDETKNEFCERARQAVVDLAGIELE